MFTRLTALCSLCFMCVIAAVSSSSYADEAKWPDKPVTIVVPWPPGGVADFVARVVSQKISASLGQSVIVENRPGAGTNIGSDYVAKARPDGYTLLLGSSNNAVNKFLFRNMPYDPIKSFTPVSLLVYVPNVLVVHPSVPAKTVGELISYAKQHPDELTYASAGNGSPAHLAAEKFKTMAGVRIRNITYKGAAPAVTDVMAGRVSMMFTNLPASLSAIQSGKLRAVGLGGTTRSPVVPNVPTIAESGVPGYEASAWYGLMAPAGTPANVIEKLQQALASARTPEALDALRQRGTDPRISPPEDLQKQLQTDLQVYGPLIKAAGITLE
ncbi:tripartite tricarboxylate transporter substrate binding protein [Pandoraea sp.]|uniref:tripartite tricarboxylate transporter substrate binding protein n=1 Tax=Pandoraea sp. TaxID=1883445 RepID=UPI0035B29878